jgi:hypothetical protein
MDSEFAESTSNERRFSLLEDRLKRTEQALLEKNNEIAKLQHDNRRLSMAVLGSFFCVFASLNSRKNSAQR